MDDDYKDSCGIGNDFSSYNDGGFCPINDDNSYSNQGGNDFSSYNDGGFCPINDDRLLLEMNVTKVLSIFH